MHNLLAVFVKTKEAQQFEFLDHYTEFRHLQIVSTMHALVEKFFLEKNIVAVAALRQAVASILKTEHFRVVRLLPNNYFVRTAATSPLYKRLEAANLIHGVTTIEDATNFARCVEPLSSQKELEPN
jgi:hypothetical protein